jgi:glyoxylase-like metal-dependent hydrolase (beta-lactamase superfamily II)
MHHQMVLIESGGKTAAFVADLMPTPVHASDAWGMGCDLYPMETLAAKQALAKDAAAKEILLLFEHDPAVAAGYLQEQRGKRVVQPA